MQQRFSFLFLVALFFSISSELRAQPLPSVDDPAALDIATWNLKWFGDPNQQPEDTQQFANVLAVVRGAGADLWGVQEVADPADFERLLDSLGAPYEGVLATNSGTQRIGYVYDSSVIQPTLVQHLFTEGDELRDFAGRPPLLMRAQVTLPDTALTVTFIVVHMKAFGDRESYERRLAAADRLKNRLDFLYPRDPVIVLGDFNDELGASTYQRQITPYQSLLADAADYTFLTLPLDQENESTYCSNADCTFGSTLDHILVTNEMAGAYRPNSVRRYAEALSIPSFRLTTTDHLPVFAGFKFATGTAAEHDNVGQKAGMMAYPNPFRTDVSLAYTATCSGPVTLRVYDAVGKLQASLRQEHVTAGLNTARVDARDWPAGAYFARLTICGKERVERLVRLP